MQNIQVDLGKQVRGFKCEIDAYGYLVVSFGSLSLADLINAIGREAD